MSYRAMQAIPLIGCLWLMSGSTKLVSILINTSFHQTSTVASCSIPALNFEVIGDDINRYIGGSR